MFALAIGGLGTPSSLIILAVIILLFGAAKLPELARGSGRALRIFKAETKGLMDGDEDEKPVTGSAATTPAEKTQAQLELETRQRDLAARQAELDAEAEKMRRDNPA